MTSQYRRRVGAVRPSHLMFTTGVGALVDLPNFSVLVRGLDDWDYFTSVVGQENWERIAEPRLLAAVRSVVGPSVTELRPAPWLGGLDGDPTGPASRVGLPVTPFPMWFRCTVCNQLAAVDSDELGFENDKPRRPFDARFFHDACKRKKSGRRPLAVAARFVLCCTEGHLDDFPYRKFVHRGEPCTKATHPPLQMDDRGGNLGANVQLRCVPCGMSRNMRDAMGRRGEENLPRCRARHPHLGTFDPDGCRSEKPPKVLVVGASNQWFAQTLSALWVPRSAASELETLVKDRWDAISQLEVTMYPFAREHVPAFRELARWRDEEIANAVERIRALKSRGDDEPPARGSDLRSAEWEAFIAEELPTTEEFTLTRDPAGVPGALKAYFADVIQAERLRETRALVGFTRLDAPDPDEPDLVERAPLSRTDVGWAPASEVRGEGIFLRVPEELLADWEERVGDSFAVEQHRAAYAQFRRNRYSDRIKGPFDEMRNWPGERFLALHTLSHLLIRAIALECGYSSASLSERIYAGTENDPHQSGLLIYTAVPDAEGTLGGLVSQAEPDRLVRIVRKALTDAQQCSSDPLCAERLPNPPADFLHGAACHVCLFVSETTCERGNRFLDRRFVVPVDDQNLALFGGPP